MIYSGSYLKYCKIQRETEKKSLVSKQVAPRVIKTERQWLGL